MTLYGYIDNVQQMVGGPVNAAVVGENNVILANSFYAYVRPGGVAFTSEADQQNTLWHEFWHILFGKDDLELVNQFVGNSATMTIAQASSALDTWLQNDCK